MVRLTLRMMERSCFWARIWAISCTGRKKRREKRRWGERENLGRAEGEREKNKDERQQNKHILLVDSNEE